MAPCNCLKNPAGDVVAFKADCEEHGGYGKGRLMDGPIMDPDGELPGADELRRALAELETRPPVIIHEEYDDEPNVLPVGNVEHGQDLLPVSSFEPRSEGAATLRFVLEVDTFGFTGDDRTLSKIAQTVALAMHRCFGRDPDTREPAMYRLWTEDGRRVMFDALAYDGEHAGHDTPLLVVAEPH